LDENFVKLTKFLEISQNEIIRLLYRQMDFLPSRMATLLCKRFAGSINGAEILPFDGDNSKFIEFDGNYFLELALKRGCKREAILISKSSVKYYEAIKDHSLYPSVITREGDKYFVYVSVPVAVDPQDLVLGVDFNFKYWVVAPVKGRPLFFDASGYSKEIDCLRRAISRAQSQRDENKVRELHEARACVVKRAHGNFLDEIIKRFGVCWLAIEQIDTMYRMRELGSRLTNNWLYSKTALRQFVLRAQAKGFEVVEVNPKDTSHICHKCGEKGVTYGTHQRLFKCKCGLKDYNRDLNAARNLAKLAKGFSY
jgi:transposase